MGACLGDQPRPNRQGAQNIQLQPNNLQTNTNQYLSVPSKNNAQQSMNKVGSIPIGKPILRPIFPNQMPQPTGNPLLQALIKPISNQFIEVKAPKDIKSWTEFQWTKEPLYFIPQSIQNMHPNQIKNRSFQQKLSWFQLNLGKKRISWTTQKSQYLEVDRENVLMSSKNQFQKINFNKEVKIVFRGQQETSDAGGLLRQWMNLCIKEIFNPELGLFKLCDTSTTYYKFNFNEEVLDLFEVASQILGIVIGKAIFERIPLKCPLNYTILRQLCGQCIQMNDIYTYDKDVIISLSQFYNGWSFMINNCMTTMMEQNFCVYEFDQHGTQNTIELKPNGFNVMVTSDNRDEYISLLIEYYCTKSIHKLLQGLKYGVYKVIPVEFLNIFNPHELDIIINGRQNIDVNDLRLNTVYSDCTAVDPVVEWFWDYVSRLNHQKLSHVLHFVTGNGRVPILGFKYLQSNRGEFQKFHIKMVDFNEIDPYPKSHTCFNRLQLPRYPNKNIFQKYIEYVTVEMIHFGLQ